MSKKPKKLSAVERIAISLDSIDGSLRQIAESHLQDNLTSSDIRNMWAENLEISRNTYKASLDMTEMRQAEIDAFNKGIAIKNRPWWKKLLGME